MQDNSFGKSAESYVDSIVRKNKSTRTVPFRYYNVIRNCGDAITSYILENSFGITGRVSPPGENHLLPIGSIFFMANSRSHIWGSGTLSPKASIPQIDPKKIYALRGKKTVEYLSSLGYSVPDVPLGDPGILVEELISPSAKPKFKAAIVPHHSAYKSARWDNIRNSDEFCFVDMMDDTLLPLKQIADSEIVLSQSLHGLIFAAALGKPYLWISGQSTETWNWKFLDWFSTCENPQDSPILLNVPVDEMLKQAEVRACLSNREELKSAFPTELIDDTPAAIGDFHFNRLASPAQAFLQQAAADGRYSPKEFVDQALNLRAKTFQGAPEPTYLALTSVGAKNSPSRAALLTGQRFLDEYREASFLWFSGEREIGDNPEFQISSLLLSEAYLNNGTVLLRPDGGMALGRKFAHLK